MKKIKLSPTFDVHNFSEPFVIAEIGANHNGDMDLAKKMIDSAVECGAHAVKFQSWTPESLVSKVEYDNNQKYDDSPKKHFGSLKEMVQKYYLREDQHFELKEYCDNKGVVFASSPFSEGEADLLHRLGVPFFKVASMDINNLRLLKYLAKFKKPIILSTGMASLAEIDQAIKIIESEGNDQIVLLHCISIYPPHYEDIHLNNITMLQEAFDYPVGFSDHTIGFSIPLASVALGACVIEKHFTTDKNLPGWDHEISADPVELKIICKEGLNITKSLGSHQRIVSDAEEAKKGKFRRSAVTARSIKKGEKIKAEDILFKRPGTGISPNEELYIVGRTVKNDIDKDVILTWESFE